MTAAPCVSVVVPFLNSASTLPACIAALRREKRGTDDVELIFVDNGSTDGSAAIVARHREIIRLEEGEPGAYAARNTGIRHARGPILAFTDADCVVKTGWVTALQRALQQDDRGAVIGQCRYPDDATGLLRLLGAWENAKAEYVIRRCTPHYHFAYANNLAAHAALFDELGLFRPWARAADSEWVHRMARERPEKRLAYCDDMRVTHLEFRTVHERLRRLALYTQTNRRIDGFRELEGKQRLAVARAMWRGSE